MKKISLVLFLAFLYALPALWAEEKPAVEMLSFEPVSKESRRASDSSLSFSVTPMKWAQARRGEIFSSGYHTADFILPSLSGEPAPIRYPRWAVREGWQGQFMMAVEVLTDGRVGRWKVMESTSHPLLDKTAAEAIRRWHFHPAVEKGKPVVSCIQIPVYFDLKD